MDTVADVGRRPARIACVAWHPRTPQPLVAMDGLRLYRMAEALARRGHAVDIVMATRASAVTRAPRLREVPLHGVCWDDYDVVKTVFHRGFDILLAAGGGAHRCIVSKLGSVVGRAATPGVHFHGAVREQLYATQEEIARRSRRVTILTSESAGLWRREHGARPPVLLVPTGVDAEIPAPGPDPARALGIDEPVVLFTGHLYSLNTQPEINRLWQERLNRLGRALRRRGLRLVAMGPGVTDLLDRDAVTHLGAVAADAVWDWQRCARAGVVLAQGLVQDNESSKIYYYLRTGLPVVCERPVPNAWLIEHSGHGVLTPYDDAEAMAAAAAALAAAPPDGRGVIDWMIAEHSWDARAALYEPLLRAAVAAAPP